VTPRRSVHVPPHCTESGCRKCIARSHWLRRRAWRTQKSPSAAIMEGSDALMPTTETPGAVACPGINMIAVYTRNSHARQVVAGFAAAIPSLGGLWEQVDLSLADVPALGSVVARLTAELASRQGRPELEEGGRDDA
jgi:hypothetical protein